MQISIRLKDVSVTFTGKNSIIALEKTNLEVKEGEFVSLLGPSGCGKTTLLRLIADLHQPNTGSIEIEGLNPLEARKKRLYGYVFQAPTLYEWRNVLGNITLPLEIMKFSKKDRVERAFAMLKLVGLENFAKHYPWQLSGGMQQRVSIARALSFDPKILLMDEPFGALDEISRENLNDELLNIWQKTKKTIIFVTHSINEAVFLSNRVVVMSARPGKIQKIIDIDLPFPRNQATREMKEFFALESQLREILRDGHR